MASAVLTNIKKEVTCPICLELMREPMSLDCGHSFCQACISSNVQYARGPGRESNCPVCRLPYKFESLRPNRHLTNIVQSLKEAELSSQEENVHHCAQHGEKLWLFCKDDGKVICWPCEQSQQQHTGHRTFLVEEIAQEYQNKLQAAVKKMMRMKEQSEKWRAELQEEKTSWKNQMQGEIENVQAKFKELRGILDSEEEKELQKLKKEHESVLNGQEKSEDELVQKNKLVTELISDLEYRLHGSRMEMLQNINEIRRRCEMLKMEKSVPFPKKERRLYQAPDLRGMLQMFQELTDARHYWAHVKINKNNHQEMVISEDLREIRYKQSYSSNSFCSTEVCFCPPGALGLPLITSGKYYWEVDVSNKGSWLLGVSDGRYYNSFRKSFRRQGFLDEEYLQSKSEFQSVKERLYQCQKGYWIIGMENKFEYKVYGEDPTTGKSLTLKFFLPSPIQRVGVFIDYEAGNLSFYNVTHNGLPIYKFTDCGFSTEIFPYFNPLKCSEPMKLC